LDIARYYTIWITKFFYVVLWPVAFPVSLLLDSLLGTEVGVFYQRKELAALIQETQQYVIIFHMLHLSRCPSTHPAVDCHYGRLSNPRHAPLFFNIHHLLEHPPPFVLFANSQIICPKFSQQP
jgi:hypothetical protein